MRTFLKSETRLAHQELDAAISQLDLTKAGHFGIFLRTHHLALRILTTSILPNHWVTKTLHQTVNLIDRDLATLGLHGPPLPMIGTHRPMHPLAIGYVVFGAHFGKSILRKKWACATTPAVLAARLFMTDSTLKTAWHRWSTEMADLSVPTEEAASYASDANRTFETFHDSLCAVLHAQRHLDCTQLG